jgi:AraC-like DNA-binding protein
MKLPRNVTPHLIHAGRREWPSGVERVSPWTGKRTLSNHEIWVISRGRVNILINGEPNQITGGHIIWFKPDREYEVIQDPQHPISINFMVFNFLDAAARRVRIPEIPAGVIDSVDVSLAESMTRRILELMWEAYHDALEHGADIEKEPTVPKPFFTDEPEMTRSGPFMPLLINIFAPEEIDETQAMITVNQLFHGLLNEIVYQLGRKRSGIVSGLEKHHRDLVASIALQMQENPKEITSVSVIALRAGYSTDHFTRTFKKIMGCSPQQFLVNARITKAKSMLLDSGLTIKEIADQLGYCNAYFFSRQFKTMTDHTPSEFRKAFSRELV